METSCKTCIHEEVCSLWRREECQDASCFQLDGCDYYKEAAACWIPVTERLPETNEKVLVWVYDPDFYKPYMDFGYWLNEIEAWGEYNDEVGDFKYYTIIAWRPLPEPPKENDGDEQTAKDI